ncbi:SHOCT domain-containing protein [Pseudonocardia sp. KRD-184]|jgi:putative membrane protein|uniref:SHOCT domain-containing protein n=3 Tax=Pseudonocardia oceani TaxID=2792013 RepID=A0ABS6UJT6_9PSEU|nr:SHOCT domain-containing protein [Pseudonocardia oceani]MBW0091940.1 SHOCT domain-containing protein [Pseudonocardia oceani]MBW0095329.1 SHOCT domain-containing protein [Pseudonocardia oceani]MBW0110909.1 SHOCT domain-containing protein [Pseudonocardia oceani]MBW0120051.1 SHOCT domain-containing protein [Pseudonocardia oceani]MBW0132507.1 SHOCT domain-containing protein [Pseudonocardia oceani]
MMNGSMMGWFWIWPVLVLIGLVLLGYLAYRLTQNRRPGTDTAPAAGPTSARQILDERYARGEINDEEYRQRRDTLT